MRHRRHRHYPRIIMVEPLSDGRARLFFSTGRIAEVEVGTPNANRVRIVYGGVGLDPGDGRELSAVTLHRRPGKVWARGYWT